jgi:hypothetical protein
MKSDVRVGGQSHWRGATKGPRSDLGVADRDGRGAVDPVLYLSVTLDGCWGEDIFERTAFFRVWVRVRVNQGKVIPIDKVAGHREDLIRYKSPTTVESSPIPYVHSPWMGDWGMPSTLNK